MIDHIEGTAEAGHGGERKREADISNISDDSAGGARTGETGDSDDANEVDPEIKRRVIFYWDQRLNLREIVRLTGLPIGAISPILKPKEKKAVERGLAKP